MFCYDSRKQIYKGFPAVKKFLALLCKFCPFCAYARKKPDSEFAKKLVEAEKNCPACKAYKEVYGG